MDKINETGIFYNKIESDYKELLKELMQKDCQRVEFIRGQLSVYSEILENKMHWKTEPRSYFKNITEEEFKSYCCQLPYM